MTDETPPASEEPTEEVPVQPAAEAPAQPAAAPLSLRPRRRRAPAGPA